MTTIQPQLEQFRSMADAGRRVIALHTTVLADHLTPVGVFDALCGDRPDTFLFESAEAGVFSRWSFIGVNSATQLIGQGATSRWSGQRIAGLPESGEPLQVLRATIDALHTEPEAGHPPFTSGMVGYFAYDIVRQWEHINDTNPVIVPVPDMIMMLVSDLAVYDHHRHELWLIANAINHDDSPEGVEAAHQDAQRRVQAMLQTLQSSGTTATLTTHDEIHPPAVQRSTTAEHYQQGVLDSVEQIKAGEAFQIVLSQRFSVPTTASDLAIYRELRSTNPSPYLYLQRFEDFSVVGSSPEALVSVTDGLATTHPIAGSRPRGDTELSDHQYEVDLLADPKERSEHLMLVDLGRNDLGKVCEAGTVTVTEFMRVRRYSHIMHIESSVSGRLPADRSALDATLACFPAGTLSGAPKVRAMQIIEELETSRRGLYGGVVGYFDFAGNSDTAIAIRTAVLSDGVAHVQAGAGLVVDSVPETEDAECRAKAQAVITAIARAEAQRPLTAR